MLRLSAGPVLISALLLSMDLHPARSEDLQGGSQASQAVDNSSVDGDEELFSDPGSIQERIAQDKPSSRALLHNNTYFAPWYDWKERLRQAHGLDFTVSLTALYQFASNTFGNEHDAAGFDFDVSGQWSLVQSDKVSTAIGFQFVNRGDLGTVMLPQTLFTQYGGLYSSAAPYGVVDVSIAQLYLQQRFGENFGYQFGRIFPISNYDFFPLKNFRTDFLDFHGAANLTIPLPDYGLGGFIRYKPAEDIRFTLGIHDANANVEKSGFDTYNGETFKIFELGFDVGSMPRLPGRPPSSFVNLSLWQVDKRVSANVDEGWGAAVTAFHRMGKVAVFGRLGWADVGSGVLPSATPARLAATVGMSYDGLIPDIDDRIAFSYTWADPAVGVLDVQHAIDAYYRVQLTPELEFGPALQVVFNPVNHPTDDTVVVGAIRTRFAF